MSHETTTDRLIRIVHQEPLSDVLPVVLSAARRIDDPAFADWVRLEMSGYYPDNPAAASVDEMPEYRTVRGRHVNARNSRIRLPNSELREKLNQNRLPHGVGALERFAREDEPVFLGGTETGRFMSQQLGIDDTNFYFQPDAVQDVLDAIRVRLIDKLEDRRAALDETTLPVGPPPTPEIDWGTVAAFVWGKLEPVRRHGVKIVIVIAATVAAGYILWRAGWVGG